MKNYRIILSPKKYDDGSIEWRASFPDISGVIGVGKTQSEALESAYVNLEAHFEFLTEDGIQLPVEITDKPAYSGKFTVRISPGLHRRVAEYAEAENISINQLTAEALAGRINEISNKHLSDLSKALEYMTTIIDRTTNVWEYSKEYLTSVKKEAYLRKEEQMSSTRPFNWTMGGKLLRRC